MVSNNFSLSEIVYVREVVPIEHSRGKAFIGSWRYVRVVLNKKVDRGIVALNLTQDINNSKVRTPRYYSYPGSGITMSLCFHLNVHVRNGQLIRLPETLILCENCEDRTSMM